MINVLERNYYETVERNGSLNLKVRYLGHTRN